MMKRDWNCQHQPTIGGRKRRQTVRSSSVCQCGDLCLDLMSRHTFKELPFSNFIDNSKLNGISSTVSDQWFYFPNEVEDQPTLMGTGLCLESVECSSDPHILHPIFSLRSILIFSSYLCLGLPVGLFLSVLYKRSCSVFNPLLVY
jgi:hypothetical protein